MSHHDKAKKDEETRVNAEARRNASANADGQIDRKDYILSTDKPRSVINHARTNEVDVVENAPNQAQAMDYVVGQLGLEPVDQGVDDEETRRSNPGLKAGAAGASADPEADKRHT